MKKANPPTDEEIMWVCRDSYCALVAELDAAKTKIRRLKERQRKIQTSFTHELSRRDSLLQEASFVLKNAQPTAENEHLAQLEATQALLNQLKTSLLKRDQVIRELRAKLSESTSSAVTEAVATLVDIAKAQPEIKPLFKQHIGCSHSLKERLATRATAQDVVGLCQFAAELVRKLAPTEPELAIESFGSESPRKIQVKTVKKKGTQQRPRNSMGPTSSFVVPILWKEDGWTPKEMFSPEP